jgi:hypothetical protein
MPQAGVSRHTQTFPKPRGSGDDQQAPRLSRDCVRFAHAGPIARQPFRAASAARKRLPFASQGHAEKPLRGHCVNATLFQAFEDRKAYRSCVRTSRPAGRVTQARRADIAVPA